PRLEPHPVGIDQRDGGYRGAIDQARHLGDAVEHRLGRRVHNAVTGERRQARALLFSCHGPRLFDLAGELKVDWARASLAEVAADIGEEGKDASYNIDVSLGIASKCCGPEGAAAGASSRTECCARMSRPARPPTTAPAPMPAPDDLAPPA